MWQLAVTCLLVGLPLAYVCLYPTYRTRCVEKIVSDAATKFADFSDFERHRWTVCALIAFPDETAPMLDAQEQDFDFVVYLLSNENDFIKRLRRMEYIHSSFLRRFVVSLFLLVPILLLSFVV